MHAFIQIATLFGAVPKDIKTPVKMAKKILLMIMDRVFLAQFTWTGKSRPGTRKIAFQEYNRTVGIIFALTSKIHRSYTKEQYRKDMVDRIFKFAYEYVLFIIKVFIYI